MLRQLYGNGGALGNAGVADVKTMAGAAMVFVVNG